MDYVSLTAANGKVPKEWASPDDYQIDLNRLTKRLAQHLGKIESISYCVSPDVSLVPDDATSSWSNLNFDGVLQEA